MTHLLNTHTYDGKLDGDFIKYIQNVSTSADEIITCGNEFLKRITEPTAQKYLTSIIEGVNTASNYDPSNNIRAENILYLLYQFIDNKDCLETLETQLIDMATGACPQGRTHRLFQVLMAYKIFD